MADTTKRLSTSLANYYSQQARQKRYEREQKEQQREYERALAEHAAMQASAQAAEEREQNKGGFLGGIGYSLEKIGLGFLSGIEGIWDYSAGGLAKLFGADDWAEQQIANDWVNYNHADEWFNPSEGWQFVGDVAGGIGTSLPAIAGVAAAGAITVASGGTLSPVAATLIAGSIAGLGAAGRATKEAYDQTGELTGKEFGYGALSGFTEGAMEGVSTALGAGIGSVTKSIAKSFGKEVAKSATRNTLLKGVVKGFAGEAFEEGVQAILDPVYKRMTYDPNAKNATFQEVAYAALVGGLSGAIMGGGDVAVRNIRGTTRGNTLVNEGKAGDVITTAEQISSYQTENQTDYETFQVVQNTLDELKTSLQKTDGEVRTVRQKMLLGVLEQANTSAAFEPIVTASAENIYNNAETVAARLNELGYQDQNGKPIQVTAEQIREGIDTTDAKKFRKTMSRALKTNSVLRTLAVADTVGQISMDTARFRDATLAGQQLSTQADLNRFVEQATDAERQAVADRLGIENWETLTNEQFHDKITEFVANGGVQEYQQERVYVKEAQAVAPEAAKKHLPRMVNLRNDGTYRYTQGGTDIAITKRGDSYYVYDYESGLMSKALSRTETNRVLREIHTNEQNYQNGVRQHTEAQNRLREQAAEIDTYARENISEYKNLSAAGQAAIRATIRQGRAAGVQEDFVLSCARVSARSGLRVVFSKEASFVAANGSYADGAIDLKNNRIIINPEAKSRSGESILIHELTHAIYNDTDGSLTVAEGLETMTDAEKEKIRKRYAAVGQGSALQVSDEINAHFAEQTLSNKNILERLVQKEQTLKEKILGFFKKARTDYQGDEKLTGAAARLYRQYKKLFDEFSARNQRYLGTENASTEARKYVGDKHFALKPYSEKQKENWKNSKNIVIYESSEQLQEFVRQSRSDNQYSKKMYFGAIGSELAARIEEQTGLNLENYNYALRSDEVRKIFKDHGTVGTEAPRGQRPVTEADFLAIPDILDGATSITLSEKKYNGQPAIAFSKVSGNERTTVVAVVSGKHLDLRVQTEYIGIKKGTLATLSGEQAPNNTPKASRGTDSTNSISQNAENVNSSPQNSGETDTNRRYALSDSQVEALKKRRVTGNRLLDVSDLADTITEVGGKITADGKAVLYHATNAEAAENIRKTGKMIGKEDNLYFATKKDGEILGYGDHVVRVQIPLERLELNDIFDNEAHLTMRTRPNTPTNIRFALPELEQEAVKHFGHTYSWAETGYVLTDGSRLDFSGRHEGSGGGGRYEDHRDIAQLDAYSDFQGTDAMIDFMKRGNIRIVPEVDGINLSVRPTRAQENTLSDFISRRRGEVTLDIDNERGETVVSVEYPRGTHSNKVLQDIRNYFENGTTPTVSEVQRFRYALPEADSTGAILSQEQREFFKDSKVVDGEGRLLKVYHGTPRGEFTVFNAQNGAYFTENEAYARRYMQAHNSPTARLIEAYLNITKPFDTRQEAERRIFEREFYRKWGNGTPLSDIGLPDWTDADDLIDFINEKGYDYDGLILDEGGDGGYGEAVTRRGVSYVAFSPEQIKLTTNKQPTKDADIRFALSDSVVNVDSANETAAWTSERVTDLIERYGATNPRYTQAYATWINPADFVKATTVNQTRRNQIYDEAGNLDIDALSRETQTPYLTVDYETMRIVGHEGRHRMAALAKAGVKRVAVAIRFTENSLSRYDARIMDGEHKLKGQTFSSWDADAQRVRTRTSHNSAAVGTLVPINAAYSAQLSEFTSERGVRFALDSSEDGNAQPRGNYSVGQRARFAANNTGMRIYTKAEAAEVINSIIEERLVFEEIGMQGELRGKDRQAVIDYLFQKLNTVKEGYRGGVALRIADYMIEHTVLTDMYAESSGEVSEAMRKLSVLRGYMHKIDLRYIQDEIQYRFDKKNSINLVWGAKEGGIAPDTLPQLLAEEGIFLDAINEADCFLQMVDMYEDARAAVNNATEQVMLSTYGDARTIKNLRQQIARDVLNAYEQKGRKSKYAKLVEKYTKQIAELKQRLRESNANNRLINSIVDQAQKMRDLKLGTFQNATQYDTEIFRSSIEKLGKIKFRGNFNIAGTRKIMADLRTWYTKDNPLLADTYEQGIADMLDEVANGKTNNYTKRELQSIRNIMAYFTNYVEHFNKVYRQGRWVDAVPEATRYIDILRRNEELKSSWFMRKVGTSYLQTFGDPMSVMRRMDRYESGFYTEIFTELRDSKIDAEIAKMQLMEEYEAFLKKNKKYLAQATKETVQYRGVEIPRMQLISLYMTLKRQHAQAGLAENGFGFWNAQDQRVRVDGFAKGITEESELRAAAVDEQARIAELLTETDKEYIAILEKGYQEAGRLKAERDIQRLGFTNATEDYYYPIRRGNIAKNVDSAEMQAELDRISNASFNKDTVRGAKQELFIESADAVFNRHVRGVVQYAYISPAIETYNKLYNLDIAGTPNKPVSVSTESANVWKQGNDYFKKLITDIQGISPVSSEGRAVLSFIRGSYAKFQLGANPKVWVTQLSSLFASSSLLDASSITRGMTVSAKDVDTYCPLAKLRAQDNTAAMAQGVLDKVGRISNVLMAPIGKMDRFVVRRLFGACQVQVQKDGGAKIGTEANKIEAGKLLKRVILETQQNSLATERSAAMRSGNEIMRTLTMFSADSMKVIGRVIDSVGELSALKARLRTTTDAESRATLQTQIKAARRNVRKSLTALATSALFMAAIAQLFNWLYNKDKDDDETAAQQVLVDFAGNLLGGLPLVRDIYSRIVEGYSVDNYAYSALNDLLDSAVNLFDTVGSLVSGDESNSKLTARTKNLLYSLGQLTGIPTRNIYNVFYGLTKRISPTTAYKIDEWFYAKNYVTDLNKAIESDDTDMIAMLTSMIFGERMGNTTMSDAVRNKFVDLYSKGYSVLPRSIGDTITYGGVEIPLTEQEYSRFRSIYAQSMKDLEKMINSGTFSVLSEEMQAKAIKQVYDAYYYDALSDLVGVDERTTVGELSKWIDMSRLSVAFAGLSDIESEKNSKGETIAGSKKKNTVKYLLKQNLSDGERLLILCFRGYTIQDGDYKGYTAKRAKRILLQYILKLKGTQAEKAVLAEKCGFTVRNGRIIRDF